MGLGIKSIYLFTLLLLFIVASNKKQGFLDFNELIARLKLIKKDCPYSDIKMIQNSYSFIISKNVQSKPRILVIGGLHGSLTAAAEIVSFISKVCLSLISDQYYSQLLDPYTLEFYPILYSDLYNQSYVSKKEGTKDKIIKVKEDGSCDPDTLFGVENNCGYSNYSSIIEKSKFIISIQGTKNHYSHKAKLTSDRKKVYDKILGKDKSPKGNAGSLVKYVMNLDGKYIFQYKHKLLTKLNNNTLSKVFSSELKKTLGAFVKNLPYPKVDFYDFSCKCNNSGKEHKVTLKYEIKNDYFFDTNLSVSLKLSALSEYWKTNMTISEVYYHKECKNKKYDKFLNAKTSVYEIFEAEKLNIYSYHTVESFKIDAGKCIRIKFVLSFREKIEFESNLVVITTANDIELKEVVSGTTYHNIIDECDKPDELCKQKTLIMLLVMLGLLMFMLFFTRYV